MTINLPIWSTDNQEKKHQPILSCAAFTATSSLYLRLFTSSFPDLLTHFIATIPFLSLIASLICPCVYNGNPLHGSSETESSEWEWKSEQSAQGRSTRFMEAHRGAHLAIRPQHWSNRWRCDLIMCPEALPHPVSSNKFLWCIGITGGGSTSWPGATAPPSSSWPPVPPQSCDYRTRGLWWAFEPCMEGDSWCQCWVSNSTYKVRSRGREPPLSGAVSEI